MDILVFGNSITQGAFDTECGGWVSRLAAYVHQKDIESNLTARSVVFNLGVSGENILGIQKRFLSEYSVRTDDTEQAIVIFAVGVNDSKVDLSIRENVTPLNVYQKTLEHLVASVRDKDTVVCVGLAPIDDRNLDPMPWNPGYAYRSEEVQRFNNVIERVARNSGHVFIPMQDVFGERAENFLVDGIHPNSKGHEHMFLRIKKVLETEGLL